MNTSTTAPQGGATTAGLGGVWVKCEVQLPPLDVPVWLWDPRDQRLWIGCRTEVESDGSWLYGNSYGRIWLSGETWDGDNETDDDYLPTHWMPLPLQPNDKDQATPPQL